MSIIFNNFVNLWLSSVTGTSDNCLRCYYCPLESSSVNVIIKHYATSHGESQFSIRHKILHEETGIFNYKSAHFPMRARDIVELVRSGQTCIVDVQNAKISFTKTDTKIPDVNGDTMDTVPVRDEAPHADDRPEYTCTKELINRVIDVIGQSGRRDDFISVLGALADGTLDADHISMHLLLDIVNFLSAETISSVRYSNTTLDFWSLVFKMFRGKATRFFRGTMCSIIITKIIVSALLLTCALGTILFTTDQHV